MGTATLSLTDEPSESIQRIDSPPPFSPSVLTPAYLPATFLPDFSSSDEEWIYWFRRRTAQEKLLQLKWGVGSRHCLLAKTHGITLITVRTGSVRLTYERHGRMRVVCKEISLLI